MLKPVAKPKTIQNITSKKDVHATTSVGARVEERLAKQTPLQRVMTICLEIGVRKLEPTQGVIYIGEAIDELISQTKKEARRDLLKEIRDRKTTKLPHDNQIRWCLDCSETARYKLLNTKDK